MMLHNFDPKLPPPLPLCHAIMGILPTPSYRVSQNHLPSSPYLRDVIYEWSPRVSMFLGFIFEAHRLQINLFHQAKHLLYFTEHGNH